MLALLLVVEMTEKPFYDTAPVPIIQDEDEQLAAVLLNGE